VVLYKIFSTECVKNLIIVSRLDLQEGLPQSAPEVSESEQSDCSECEEHC
jgi:hypothetical protein